MKTDPTGIPIKVNTRCVAILALSMLLVGILIGVNCG